MAGVELLFGPLLIGVVLNMMLYGVVCIQMFTYFQRYPNDSAWIRCFMLYLLVVETVNVVIEFGIIYQPLIIQNGQQAAIAISPKLLPGDSVLISIVSGPIQLFTAWRISVITGSFILPGIIALLSLGSFAAGITVSVMVSMNPAFHSFESFTTEVIVWLVLSAVCDIVIAVGMTYALYTRKTGFSVIDGQINRIIRLTVETGVLTAITALVDVTLFLAFPRTTINFIVDFPLSALYTCSILAMLNSRDRQRAGDAEHMAPQTLRTQDHGQTTLIAKSRPPSFHSSKKSQTKVEIYMSTSTEKEKMMGRDHTDMYTTSQTILADSNPRYNNYSRPTDLPRTRTPDGSDADSERTLAPSYSFPRRDPTMREPSRTRTDSDDSGSVSQQKSLPLPLNPPEPDFYNYNGTSSPRTRGRTRTLSNDTATPRTRSRTLSNGTATQRSLPSNPRPVRPTLPQPQVLGMRPKTIIAPDRPLTEKF